MLSRIVIKNYRMFRDFELAFNVEMNILVGDNAAGKSTLIEAIGLAMTGLLHGRQMAQELSPYLFNGGAVAEYLAAVRAGGKPTPPGSSSICSWSKLTSPRSIGCAVPTT
ncbi:hypothetical protein GCM10023088_07720 [Actinomadura verrucosospora]|uniref:AAA family ATPase n=1 Tax=Actinomadura verrucosospora TaxID=46165 RepID=UPI0031EFEB1D